jgi:hypothetical protein
VLDELAAELGSMLRPRPSRVAVQAASTAATVTAPAAQCQARPLTGRDDTATGSAATRVGDEPVRTDRLLDRDRPDDQARGHSLYPAGNERHCRS